MISTRNTHYFLWFVLFGLIAGLATKFNTESIVVAATGLAGMLLGAPALARFSKIYDMVIGLIFAVVGLLGILASLKVANTIGISTSGAILGLSLAIPYSLIHTVLGLTSLNHAFKPTVTTAPVTVAPPREVVAG